MQFGLDARVFGKAKLAAIGDATADAIRQHLCLSVALCPESFVAEALADELERRGEVGGRKFLLLRADIARPLLRERLERAGASQVNDVAVYETHPAGSLPPHLIDALDAKQVTWVTFTSSSTARNFVTLLGDDYKAKLAHVKLASIGPITTATLRELGLTPTVEAKQFNIAGLVAAIAESSPPRSP
jgi:uroporphyrinogen III methyltransferase/synthase